MSQPSILTRLEFISAQSLMCQLNLWIEATMHRHALSRFSTSALLLFAARGERRRSKSDKFATSPAASIERFRKRANCSRRELQSTKAFAVRAMRKKG